MKNILIGFCLTAASAVAMAEIPAGYYTALEGKSGAELKAAVKAAAQPAGFTVVSYNSGTWKAFAQTDVRLIEGDLIWRDMYSNRMVYVSTGHDCMNIEHSVANSWWGGDKGSHEAYCDLFHLNPSDADANNKKSNHPLGEVADARIYDNGLVKIGTPASGFGGGAATVFEPADEHKGDFARAYLYVFTAYSNVPWLSDQEGSNMLDISAEGAQPKPWVVDMLLRWSAADPVDDTELTRNEEIYKIQKNRNPFIDYPALAEYIYGSRQTEGFTTAGNEVQPVNRPSDPKLSGLWLTGVNTYSGRYWEGTDLQFDCPDGDLWISYDGGEFQRYGERFSLPSASTHGEKHTLKAYSAAATRSEGLRSSYVYVTMTGRDAAVTDYTDAIWTPVTATSEIEKGKYYIILSSNVKNIMGCTANDFMPSCGYCQFKGDDVSLLPEGAALVSFVPVEGSEDQYMVRISDALGNSKGYWSTKSSNKMKLDASTGTPATVSVNGTGEVDIAFTSNGSLKYNKTQPRFSNYTSNQGTVLLYKFKEFPKEGQTGVTDVDSEEDMPIAVSGRDIIVPAGGAVYDLNGRRVSGRDLAPGVYVAVKPNGASVKILIH